MDKVIKIVGIGMIVMTVAALNLSSACDPGSVTAAPLVEVAKARPEIPATLIEDEDTPSAPIKELTWKLLADVEFKDMYIEELDAYYWQPTFGAAVKAMEGEEVYITGYIIPVDYDEDFYVLSRYPFANCFFCGGAGPESVIDLRFKSKTRTYKTDERLTFKGKLKLNKDDVYQMNYILEGAEEYTP